jgi:hypothetical protein
MVRLSPFQQVALIKTCYDLAAIAHDDEMLGELNLAIQAAWTYCATDVVEELHRHILFRFKWLVPDGKHFKLSDRFNESDSQSIH